MRSLAGLPFDAIAFEVCSAFDRAGVVAVLVGGGAAAFYAPKAYETRDLDFVLAMELFGAPDESVIAALGFVRSKTRGTYVNPDIPFTLEILPGPLAAGDETLAGYQTLHRESLVLHIVSPTDCVKDRLAAAIHWHDLNSARQAAEVAKLHEVDLVSVRLWCEAEGGADMFARFLVLLER